MENAHRKTFRVASLGCRTNQYEAQAFRDQLIALGYDEAGSGEAAEICVVNTCTVTEGADRSSRHQVRQFVRQNPNAKIVVTGCYAERQPDQVHAIEGVTHVIPNLQKENLIATLFPEEEIPEFSIKGFESHTRAFVKVQDGCNSFCTYCIIPYVRGRSRCRPIPDVIREVQELVENGYKEVVITGINVGDYEGGLASLVRAVDGVEGLERIRVSSIDPDEVDEELADVILNGKKTCHSMHIVLQSGSNVILKKMNRKYTRQVFLDTIGRLKRASPDFGFTTDVIVGFPGETEIDFRETLEVMREVKFAKVHMFPYSKRDRTRAALFPNPVPQPVIQERKEEVLRVSEKMAFELRTQFVGREMTILTENRDPAHPGMLFGHTDNFLPVWIEEKEYHPNQLVKVNLVENTPEGLRASYE